MKPYLLIAGDCYYPSSGTGDWIDCYETVEEAREEIENIDYHNNSVYKIRGRMFEWYDIVDLREWTER